MDNRLHAIVDLVHDGIGLIDVGTDHGFLPVSLAQNGYTGKLIASDINDQPLSSAISFARANGLEDRISFTVADGLSACRPDEIDTIVIAGMGAEMICHILDAAEWCCSPGYTFILQPMTKPEVLRYWLCNNGFNIYSEKIIRDRDFFYSVIGCTFTGQNEHLCDAELFLGKRELSMQNPDFNDSLQHLISVFEKKLNGLKFSARGKAEYLFYSEILENMRDF